MDLAGARKVAGFHGPYFLEVLVEDRPRHDRRVRKINLGFTLGIGSVIQR
jgi:hypothetical protein